MTSIATIQQPCVQFSYQDNGGYAWDQVSVTLPQQVTFQTANVASTPFNSRLQRIIDVLPSAVIVLDATGHVVECNSLALDFLGEPLIGELWVEVIQRAFAPKEDDGYEVSLSDGRLVRVDTRSLMPEPGQLIVITDLTETRKLQAQLSHHQRLMSLGKMVASLAHQIRTPLSTSMLYASNLASLHLTDEKRTQFAQKLQSSLSHLEHQVKDMLLFAKGGEMVATHFSVEQLLQQFQQVIQGALTQHGAQLQVHNRLDQSMTLFANLDALLGAMTNIVNNSLQARPAQCDVYLNVHQPDDSCIEIQVIDNGPGMDSNTLQHILEPFFTTKSHGTGLGLAVVKSVVEAHRGRVAIASILGKGTVVTLRLPVKPTLLSAMNNEQAA